VCQDAATSISDVDGVRSTTLLCRFIILHNEVIIIVILLLR
jgi:hypothetical protein